MKARAHVFVKGRVQGVFFRVTTRNQATKRNVTGWVRNTTDGKVEATFEGKQEDIEKMIDFCKKGPTGALVTDVTVKWQTHSGDFKDFKIQRTHTQQ